MSSVEITDRNTSQRPTTIDISSPPWPGRVDRWLKVPFYGKTRGAIEDAANRYSRTLGEEVEVVSSRSPGLGRLCFWGGHVLGWGGLALAIVGLFSLGHPDFDDVVFGPFGIGLLGLVACGPLIRYGRRLLTPSAAEVRAVDVRRPVLLLASFHGSDNEIVASTATSTATQSTALEDTVGQPFMHYGPFSAMRTGSAPSAREGEFGAANWEKVSAREMDRAVLLVAMPAAGPAVPFEIDAIVARRHAHKLLVLMPTLSGVWPWKSADGTDLDIASGNTGRRQDVIETALSWRPRSTVGAAWDRTKQRVRSPAETEEALRVFRWSNLRAALKDVPGFGMLPEQAPPRLIAMHLTAGAAPVFLTGPKVPTGSDYVRAIAYAVYGMKCHGKS